MTKALSAALTVALLAGCGGSAKHFPLQPVAPSNAGAYHIRSVTILDPNGDIDPDFESGFRKALNAGANADTAEGAPVDLVLTLEAFHDASIAEEMIGGGSYARAEIRLNDPARRNRPIFRDRRSAGQDPTNVSANVQTSESSGPISFLASLAASAIIGAVTNEAEGMGATVAGYLIEDLLEPGTVRLPKNAAFALPPQGRDPAAGDRNRDAPFKTDNVLAAAPSPGSQLAPPPAFEAAPDAVAAPSPGDPGELAIAALPPADDSAAARPDSPVNDARTPASGSNDALFLGAYAERAAAEAERADILMMDSDLVSADRLSVTEQAGRFVVSAALPDAADARALCARRSVENRPCGDAR